VIFSLSARCGFDANAIAERLGLLDLDQPDALVMGEKLQEQVICPNEDSLVDDFCESLTKIDEFNNIVNLHSGLGQIRETQSRYLRSLGVDFQRREYFEERLRIGCVHQRIGVPQGLYQCAFQQLQDLLIEAIPLSIREEKVAFDEMLRFILKITALDMSLANESYFKSRVVGLQNSLKSERGEKERLRKLSITDWLTELHNHSYSRRCLAKALERSKWEGAALCVIMADLDHFKEINDEFGHLVGDDVLRIAAARMLSGARSADEVGRYGGEEFMFILQDTDIREAEEVAERVRSRIRSDAMHCGDATINITLSLGLAQARADDTVNSLIERADEALYAAKAAGRDCVRMESNADLERELN